MSQKKLSPMEGGVREYLRLHLSPVFPKAQICSCYIVIKPDAVTPGSVPGGRFVQTCTADRTLSIYHRAKLSSLTCCHSCRAEKASTAYPAAGIKDNWMGLHNSAVFLQSSTTWITRALKKKPTKNVVHSTKIRMNWRKQLELTGGRRQRSKQTKKFLMSLLRGRHFPISLNFKVSVLALIEDIHSNADYSVLFWSESLLKCPLRYKK